MILYLYGFGCSPWPTLEEAAWEFNLGTRERARQIKQKFVNLHRSSPMPALQTVIDVLSERKYWLQSDLANCLRELELAEHRISISGLLNLARRLRNLESTDETIETKRRLEQPILREWLFEDTSTASCAICRKEYNVSSLVTAHKKKRSDCSFTERTEPYIVVPLCRFGCDFLYETRYVIVEEGTVRRGTPLQHQVAENGYLEQVVGNKVDNEWLVGPKFDSWN